MHVKPSQTEGPLHTQKEGTTFMLSNMHYQEVLLSVRPFCVLLQYKPIFFYSALKLAKTPFPSQ